jgi:hypothetical protein
VKSIPLFFLLLLCVPAEARAYDAASLATDSAAFLDAENLMHWDLSTAVAALRKSQPLMIPGETSAMSGDLSLGSILAPAFAYRGPMAGNCPFAGIVDPDGGAGASVQALSAGGAMAFPGGFGWTFNASYLPPLNLDGAEKSLFRIGASGYWRLLPERFYSVGVLVGGGATYIRGTERRAIAANFIDASVARALAGELDSEWNCAVFDLELFVHKTFFIVNFYSRTNLCMVLGSSSSTLRDVTVDGLAVSGAQAEYSSVLREPSLGLVMAGGMELILGELKLAAEAGRDWLSGSLYGSIGLRFGM